MADNPLKYSDLVQPDGSIEQAIEQLEKLQITYSKTLNTIKSDASKTHDALKKINSTTESGRKETEKSSIEADKLSKAYDSLTRSQSEAGLELTRLKLEQQKQNRLNKLTIKLNESAEGSYDKLSTQYSINKIKLNQLSKEQRSSTAAGKELEEKTNDIYTEMKRLQEATGKHVLSVGDYEKGWKGVSDQLAQVPGASGKAAAGLQGVSAAMKSLLANPVVLVISAVIASFTALYSLFARTKRGADFLGKSAAMLSGIMSALVSVVDKLSVNLQEAFNDPQKAMVSFWNALKKNIVNRLSGVVLLVEKLGDAFKSLWQRDLVNLKKAGTEAAKALLQINTGLDEKQQKEYAEQTKETTNAILDQIKAFASLEESKYKVRRSNRELQKSLEDLITKEELAKSIADDNTKSFLEREKASEKASELTVKRAKVQQQIASSNLNLINTELDLRSKNGESVEDLLDQQLSSYQELKQAQRDYILSVRDNQKRESELIQDRLERDLDILIDGFDNQKTINEKIIADDTLSFEKRRSILDQTKVLFEDTFAKQIETVQKFTDIQIDSNELINESDAVVLNQKIRSLGLSEIIEGRLLEITRDRKTGIQDLIDVEKELAEKKSKSDDESVAKSKANKKKTYDAAIELVDQELDLEMSKIDIMKTTEAEKTRLRLEAEKERLKAILDLNKSAESELSSLQIDTISNTIKKIDQQLQETKNQDFDLYSAVGIKLDDDKKEAIAESVSFAVDNIKSILAAKVEAADIALQKSQEESDNAKSKLDQEIEARNNGYANNVIQAQKELELSKKNEAKALKEKQKAQKAQEAIDTISQTTGLITASVQIFKSLSGIPVIGTALAIAAVGTMFSTYAASKVKAKSLAKEKLEKGGYEFLQGGSHASGNDIPIGMTSSGKQRTAEGGEALAVINKRNTRKYRSIIPSIVDSLNKGTFEKSFANTYLPSNELSNDVFVNSGMDSPDLRNIRQDISEIRKRGERQRFTNADGKMVEVYKNVTRIYV